MDDIKTQQDLTLGFYDEYGYITMYGKQGDTQRYIRFEFTEDVIPEDKEHFFAYIRGKYSDGSLIPIAKVNDKDSITKETVMPEPSETYLGIIYKYIGETGTYINGHYYQCFETENNLYEWRDVVIDDEIGDDYILFHIPSYMLAIPGKTFCDLVLCKSNGDIYINPDGTISDDQIEILSTHQFIISVEALPSEGGELSPIQREEMDELTTLVIAAREVLYEKGIMDLHIDEDGHLIYQCSTDMSNMDFSIQNHKDLVLTIN